MISVIISTFKRPERLKKAIESVIAQTYKDWELIVVSDGLCSFTGMPLDKRIVYMEIEHFGCDTKPKNYGIQFTKGEFVAFLDDDNIFRPDHLQSLLTAIEKDPDLALVYGDRWIVDETGKITPRMGVFSEFNPGLLLQRNYIDTSDVLVRRSALIDVGGFDERFVKYVDWNLWLRMAKAGYIFKRVPLILTDYHLHEDQKSVKIILDKEKIAGVNTPSWDPFDCEIELEYLGEKKEPRVAIYTLTYDRLDYTKRCFESLHKTAGYDFDHIIVDNGSTDGTPAYLQDFEFKNLHKVKVISNATNNGISKASNQAITTMMDLGMYNEHEPTMSYDIVVKVDNDALFLTDGWLAKMVDIWKSNHMLALSCYPQGLKDNPGGAPRIGYGQIKGELLGMTKHLGGLCHFVSAKAYKDFRWDEEDFLHGIQDLEFSHYLILKGYQQGYLENFFVSHMDGTEGQHKKYPQYFERRKREKQTRYEKGI